MVFKSTLLSGKHINIRYWESGFGSRIGGQEREFDPLSVPGSGKCEKVLSIYSEMG